MNIPLRLLTIASFIKPFEVVADIGADHGLLELFLIARNTNNSVVAIENKKGPYEILRENLIGIKNIRLSFSSGLEAVDKSVNTLVLAGMGGLNIVRILEEYPNKVSKVDKIIIDAHRDTNVVRKYLTELNFKIKKEKIVFEKNTYYVIIVFEKSDKKVSYKENELEFGYKINKDPLWKDYKAYLLNKSERNLNNIAQSSSNPSGVKELKAYIKRLKSYGKN